MARPKGGKNKEWSTEEKLRIITRVMNGEGSSTEIGIEENVDSGQIRNWVYRHKRKGIEGITNKKKPGNPLTKFQNRKNLTELEKLQYENMKLRIENERLKKGYTNEEAMSIKQKKSHEKNMK